jgi:hypothetical protein
VFYLGPRQWTADGDAAVLPETADFRLTPTTIDGSGSIVEFRLVATDWSAHAIAQAQPASTELPALVSAELGPPFANEQSEI